MCKTFLLMCFAKSSFSCTTCGDILEIILYVDFCWKLKLKGSLDMIIVVTSYAHWARKCGEQSVMWNFSRIGQKKTNDGDVLKGQKKCQEIFEEAGRKLRIECYYGEFFQIDRIGKKSFIISTLLGLNRNENVTVIIVVCV